jgi:hypothetical protein
MQRAQNLPLSLLDRLLASEIVPLEAKLSAIESWRRELADAAPPDTMLDALSSRLAHAPTYLQIATSYLQRTN